LIRDWTVPLAGGGTARSRFTTRCEGDLRAVPAADGLAGRRCAVVDLPWSALTQVHGREVVVVDETVGGVEGDALVTGRPRLALSVNVADCAPVAIVSRQHVVAAVHAGWKGIEAGVIEATVDAMRRLGARDLVAWLGPCIHPECYEFGNEDLDRIVARYGPGVRSRTAGGARALDLPMAVAAALGGVGVELADAADACTACDGELFYSYRARHDDGRHALVVWMDPSNGDEAP
jgi:YfiH family protein